MKVAIGEFLHESNSFAANLTKKEAFEKTSGIHAKGWGTGEEVIELAEGARTGLGGIISKCREYGWVIVPTIIAETLPSGPISKETFDEIKGEFINRIKANMPIDGVLLHLHGAATVDKIDDAEGDLIRGIREVVGKDVPILSIFDLHGNIRDDLVNNLEMANAYDTQPHEDIYDRGIEITEVFKNIIDGKIKPVSRRIQPPFICSAINTDTSMQPMKSLMRKAFEFEDKEEDIIDVSVFCGFGSADKDVAGPSIVVTTNDNAELANLVAKDMARELWNKKDEFYVDLIDMDEAIIKAKKESGLWALMDGGDDPLGGAPGDGTTVLEKLIDNDVHSAAITFIKDEEMATKAFKAGVGNKIEGLLGGKTDGKHGNPVPVVATVISISTDEIPIFEWLDDLKQDAGKIAVLDIDGIIVPVAEKMIVTECIDIFGILGIDYKAKNIIVLKGLASSYTHIYKDIPKEYVLLDSAGIGNYDLTKIGKYKKLRRPCYPFDKNVEFNV